MPREYQSGIIQSVGIANTMFFLIIIIGYQNSAHTGHYQNNYSISDNSALASSMPSKGFSAASAVVICCLALSIRPCW